MMVLGSPSPHQPLASHPDLDRVISLLLLPLLLLFLYHFVTSICFNRLTFLPTPFPLTCMSIPMLLPSQWQEGVGGGHVQTKCLIKVKIL